MLHVTNGDSAAGNIARSGLEGDILSWRDVLHDGPVPPDDDLEAFRRTRSRFIGGSEWATDQSVLDDFVARDNRLEGVSAGEAITLWFEPDLYDQLQLIQVLSRFARRAPGERPLLSIVPADVLLGPLEPKDFPSLFHARRPVTGEDLQHGEAAWHAFTSGTPDALMAMLAQLDREITACSYAEDGSIRLPHLAAALHRMLEEYPDAATGLSRSERQICEALVPGAMTLGKLFPSHGARETWAWLGDWSFGDYVVRISDCASPLVTDVDGSRVPARTAHRNEKFFWQRSVVLTPFGAEVLQGRADAIAANGIDKWIGGVHLTTGRHWRWDSQLQRTVAQP